jgi:DNA repair exonuclease SbcCD ATPase subunit
MQSRKQPDAMSSHTTLTELEHELKRMQSRKQPDAMSSHTTLTEIEHELKRLQSRKQPDAMSSQTTLTELEHELKRLQSRKQPDAMSSQTTLTELEHELKRMQSRKQPDAMSGQTTLTELEGRLARHIPLQKKQSSGLLRRSHASAPHKRSTPDISVAGTTLTDIHKYIDASLSIPQDSVMIGLYDKLALNEPENLDDYDNLESVSTVGQRPVVPNLPGVSGAVEISSPDVESGIVDVVALLQKQFDNMDKQ